MRRGAISAEGALDVEVDRRSSGDENRAEESKIKGEKRGSTSLTLRRSFGGGRKL